MCGSRYSMTAISLFCSEQFSLRVRCTQAEFVMHNTDYTDEAVYPELRERLRGYPGVEAVTPAEFRHWASLVRKHYINNINNDNPLQVSK